MGDLNHSVTAAALLLRFLAPLMLCFVIVDVLATEFEYRAHWVLMFTGSVICCCTRLNSRPVHHCGCEQFTCVLRYVDEILAVFV